MKKSKSKKIKKIILSVFIALAVLIAGVFAFCMIPMKNHDIDPKVFESEGKITVTEISSGITAFVPEKPAAGLIFYQGARVDAKAYAPLMRELSERDILAVLLDSPFNLAFFGMNMPDGIQEKFPQVSTWYIGGHSMGAEVAGEYLNRHLDEYDGLALFAGFVTNDFSKTGISAFSVYGENDGVLTGSYKECLSHLPKDFSELVIDGGNHAGFAYYGPQKGDGEAEISKDEQIRIAADFCEKAIKSNLNK